MSKHLPKIETLLVRIRRDLLNVQKELKLNNGSEYFSPAVDAYWKIENQTRDFLKFVDAFTPAREHFKKHNYVILELLNIDEHEKLTEQVGNYDWFLQSNKRIETLWKTKTKWP